MSKRMPHPMPQRRYNRNAPRKGAMSDADWETALQMAERYRTQAPKWAKDGHQRDASLIYNHAHALLEETESTTKDLPSPRVFNDMPKGDAKREVVQRAFGRLRNKLLVQGGGQGKGEGEKGKAEQPKAPPAPGGGGGMKLPVPKAPAPEEDDDEDDDENDEDEGEDEEEEESNDPPTPASSAPSQRRGIAEEASTHIAVPSSGGGEDFYGSADDPSLFYATRYIFKKLAEHQDRSETVDFGQERWDVRRLLTAKYNPRLIDHAKRDYARYVEDVYLILDTSGSVSYLAGKIASLAAGAAGLVHLYGGEEARPENKCLRSSPLKSPADPFPEWSGTRMRPLKMQLDRSKTDWVVRADYTAFRKQFNKKWEPFYPDLGGYGHSFEVDVAWWLHLTKPRRGSRILFWGDTQGCGMAAPKLLKQMLRPYRTCWLHSMTETDAKSMYPSYWDLSDEKLLEDSYSYRNMEAVKLHLAGIPLIWGVTDAVAIRRALGQIQLARAA